jgi:crotonobetainyl-CoA:carnitine CoA-transferase CaiB-like acyl-CoA transferase
MFSECVASVLSPTGPRAQVTHETLTAAFAGHQRDELVATLNAGGVPAEVMVTCPDIYEPNVTAEGLWAGQNRKPPPSVPYPSALPLSLSTFRPPPPSLPLPPSLCLWPCRRGAALRARA